MPDSLLVELLTEELPPKSLRQLSEAFKDRLTAELVKAQLAKLGGKAFATPRRLAVLIPDVLPRGEDRETEVAGPPAKAAPQAIAGFAKKHGLSVEALRKKTTDKGE